MAEPKPDRKSILDDAWDDVVGGMEWLQSVLMGEFSDNRPLSAIVADMLLSFVPGVVIVTSARDAVAVILRLARHPEKREELMEWVLLCACLIVIALPIAMAAGGAAALGVGAIVGGIAGSELGAALRAVMLMLIKEASTLVELVRFLQMFVKGDILKFLRAVQFAKYERPLIEAMRIITGKIVEIVIALRVYLQGLRYFDSVKDTIAKLTEWEKKFYVVQQDALKQVPKALVELDARLLKVLAQTAPKEVHTVAAGVRANKVVATPPAPQRIRDTSGQSFGKVENHPPRVKTKDGGNGKRMPAPKGAAKDPPESLLKDSPAVGKPPEAGSNTKKQAVIDAVAVADKKKITQLSNEAREAEKAGNLSLAEARLDAARNILKPYLPKNPGDKWDEVIKRLDVDSPHDGAVFWSGTANQARVTGQNDAARVFAEKRGGVTLEMTPGGRIVDGWKDVNNGYPWNAESNMPGPYASELWSEVSKKYAQAVSGDVNVIQTPDKLWDPRTVWHQQEKPILTFLQETGKVTSINMQSIDATSATYQLTTNHIEQLMKFDQRPK